MPSFIHHSGTAGDGPGKEPTPRQETPVVPVVEETEVRLRGEDGRFVSSDPSPEYQEEQNVVMIMPEQEIGDFDMDASPEIYRCGTTLGVRGSTWMMSPKSSKADFKDDFAKSFYKAARDYGSWPPSAAQPLVHDAMLAENRANRKRVSPITYIEGTEDSFRFQNWFRGEGYEYYVHCDMSKNRDAAGVAMSHYDHHEDRVVIDLMLTLKAPQGGELRLSRFRQLVFELTNMGFSIGKVTFDQWQSLETQQELRMRGYVVEQYSVDRTTMAYDTLVELMLAGTVDYYYDAVFVREFQELSVIEGKKVDHPEGGSKDLTDACAAVCVHALETAKVKRQSLPGVVKFGMGGGGVNRDKAPGAALIGGITAESQGLKATPQNRILAI